MTDAIIGRSRRQREGGVKPQQGLSDGSQLSTQMFTTISFDDQGRGTRNPGKQPNKSECI